MGPQHCATITVPSRINQQEQSIKCNMQWEWNVSNEAEAFSSLECKFRLWIMFQMELKHLGIYSASYIEGGECWVECMLTISQSLKCVGWQKRKRDQLDWGVDRSEDYRIMPSCAITHSYGINKHQHKGKVQKNKEIGSMCDSKRK